MVCLGESGGRKTLVCPKTLLHSFVARSVPISRNRYGHLTIVIIL